MVKDVSIADSLIKDLSADKPLSENVSNYLSKSLAELGKNSDHTEVYKVLKR
jgi:3-hydroxyisobutyrate dehydrogenase-like beta-hydroxyacid dehydrogenase